MNKIIKEKIAELNQLCKDYQVKSMHIFGSATTAEFNSSSDIDLLIKFENLNSMQYADNYFDLHYRLQALFGSKITEQFEQHFLLYRGTNRKTNKNQK